MSKAGQQFQCVCCREPKDEDEASYDDQLGGPVCNHCRFLLLGATAWLKKADIKRPLAVEDINHFNCNRFKNYKI